MGVEALNNAIPILRGQMSSIAVAIASGGTTPTDPIDGRFASAFGLVMPSSLTSTTMTFTVSWDGTNFQALYDIFNAQVSMTVAASRSYDLPTELFSWPYWKPVLGSAEGAARTLYVVMKT